MTLHSTFPSDRLAIGIDLGGTQVKGALVDRESGEILRTALLPTRDGEFEDGKPVFAMQVAGIIAELETGGARLPAGLAAPGLAAPHGRCITWMPGRMRGLEGFDWPRFLQRGIRVINDAQAALLGEVWTGAAKGCRDVFMVTLGTGVGGAVLSGGRLLTGASGRGGHLGHICVDVNAPRDVFHTPGSLEAMLGNATLRQRTGGRFASTLELVQAAQSGDAEAMLEWRESVRRLAAALASLVNVLDPEVIILGGGIATGAGDALMRPLEQFMDDYEWRPGGLRVPLKMASAGEWAGALGAVNGLRLAV